MIFAWLLSLLPTVFRAPHMPFATVASLPCPEVSYLPSTVYHGLWSIQGVMRCQYAGFRLHLPVGSLLAQAEGNYWRPNNRSLTFYECSQSHACQGFTETGDCDAHYVPSSVLCTACVEGYALEGVYKPCIECSFRVFEVVSLEEPKAADNPT